MAKDVKARPGLTAERVVHAALRAADEGGIESVSLRRLAEALDVTPMAIYRHVRNKSHLLDLMAEWLLEQVDLAPDGSAAWQDRLRRLLGSYQAVVAAHPAAPLLLSRPFVSPAAPRATEALLAILSDAGFDTAQSARLLQVMSGMLLGPAIHRATWAAAERDRPRDADRQQASMETLSAEEFPYHATAAQFMDWSAGPDADRLTIQILVGGLEALAGHPNRTQDEIAALRRSRRRVAEAANADRRGIERDLHDGVQQHLVALAVDLQHLAGLAHGDPAAAKALLDELAANVRGALDETTKLATRVYPPMLDGRGLASTLRSVANSAGVTAVIDVPAVAGYLPEITAAVYWTWVEALSSASRGSQAAISAHDADGVLTFEVTISGLHPREHLERMRDRIEALDGHLTVDYLRDGDSRLQGRMPLSR
jgi:signal transduction histidine kinase